MYKKYLVRLTEEEREICRQTVQKLKGTSEKVRRAQVLLKADVDGPAWGDLQISEAFDCTTRMIETLRKQFVTEGFEKALNRQPRATSPTPKLLNGEQEAKLIAMRLGKPPAGFGRWTLHLLADQFVALEVVESISHETVRQTLKKTA